jgi:hypothetical protein
VYTAILNILNRTAGSLEPADGEAGSKRHQQAQERREAADAATAEAEEKRRQARERRKQQLAAGTAEAARAAARSLLLAMTLALAPVHPLTAPVER